MVYFDKKVYYIDYYENDVKRGNGGFVSLTFKEDECLVHVGIRNLPTESSLICRWFGIKDSRRIFLEEINVNGGKADFVRCYKKDRLGRKEVDIEELDGFYFSLGNRKWGSCFSGELQKDLRIINLDDEKEERELMAAEKRAEDAQEKKAEDTAEKKAEDAAEKSREKDGNEIGEENGNEAGEEPCGAAGEAEQVDSAPEYVGRTSWEELLKTHQRIHPFEEQGDYISINPFTLKLLAPQYRSLSNNSFLLHGFYNYRHLILGYYRDMKREGFYIGVPGTFHEKEQMVAEMFGFEGYEPSGPIGYYMRRVEF